jgi:acyl carrier protein
MEIFSGVNCLLTTGVFFGHMTHDEIRTKILLFFQKEFEIENPALNDDLRAMGFDSIDAIELLLEIEKMLGSELTHEEKQRAMDIRTLNHVCDYIESLANARAVLSK